MKLDPTLNFAKKKNTLMKSNFQYFPFQETDEPIL